MELQAGGVVAAGIAIQAMTKAWRMPAARGGMKANLSVAATSCAGAKRKAALSLAAKQTARGDEGAANKRRNYHVKHGVKISSARLPLTPSRKSVACLLNLVASPHMAAAAHQLLTLLYTKQRHLNAWRKTKHLYISVSCDVYVLKKQRQNHQAAARNLLNVAKRAADDQNKA